MKIKIRKIQVARRAVQISVLVLLLAIPAISRYANYVAARELDKNLEKWQGSLQGETLALIDSTFRSLPGGEKERAGKLVRNREAVLGYSQAFRGGPWSAEVAGLSLTDPLAATESIVARKRAAPVLLISIVIPVLLTLIFGRIFCSWICPMGLFLELTDKLRRLMRFLEIRPRNIRFSRWTKYALLGAGLVVAYLGSIPVLAYIYPPAIINREAHDLVFTLFDRAEDGLLGFSVAGLTGLSVVLGAIALFEITVSRRWWCRYLCPGGALYGLLGATRPLRVRLLETKCTHCAECVPACPMGLNPMLNRMGIECDNCGLCISYCGDGALTYGLWSKETLQAPLGTRPSMTAMKGGV